MPIFIECPACGRRLRVPDGLQAPTVQCANCGTAFPVAAEAKPSPSAPPPAEESGNVLAETALRPCPYCSEDIPREAKQCRFCGEAVDEEEGGRPPWQHPGEVRRDSEPHRGKLLLTLGIVGLVVSGLYGLGIVALPLGITVWLLGRHDLHRMHTQEMDPKGEILTRAGQTCGMIGIVLGSMWLFAFVTVFLISMAF